MKEVLLALLIVVTGLRFVCESGAFYKNYSIIKIAAHEEESKNKNEENKHDKCYNEDISYAEAELKSSAHVTTMSALSVIHEKPYLGFTGKPNIPPPDLT